MLAIEIRPCVTVPMADVVGRTIVLVVAVVVVTVVLLVAIEGCAIGTDGGVYSGGILI